MWAFPMKHARLLLRLRLVETAFVSNEREEARLKDPDYQDTTAEGILEGIRAYIAGLK